MNKKNGLLQGKARGLAAAALLTALAIWTSSWSPAAYAAAVPKLDSIRVALLLDNGNLTSNEAQVTLSSAKGLNVGLKTPTGVQPLPVTAAAVKAALDSYGLLLLDTGDFAKAKALRDRLLEQDKPVSVWARVRQGKAWFQVAAGPYPTKEEASAALTALTSQPAVAALADKPSLTGPLHLQAGLFATEAEALKQRDALSQVGIDSDIAMLLQSSGTAGFAVWAGNETDPGKLNALKAQIQLKQPSLSMAPADATRPYLIRRDDLSLSSSGTDPIPSFLLQPKDGKLQVTPKEGRIAVKEKANRSYRGAMEISGYNGKPALVNELPLEAYLYSVVSGEMGTGWPAEALKAQAVAARTYALKAGMKYPIANVSDGSFDQVYRGSEFPDVIQAVDATRGEVLTDKDGLITAYFSSNAGGMTSSGEEIWGKALPYLKIVPSPDDGAAKNKAVWRQVALADGKTGYVHSSYLKADGRLNPAGLAYYTATENGVNVRAAPFVDDTDNPSVAKLNAGDRVAAFGEARESNAYSWFRGPYGPAELLQIMNAKLQSPVAGALQSLSVTKRGPSGRAVEVSANGKPLAVSTPDALRTVFGGLPSTRFEIEETGRYTIGGANGSKSAVTGSKGLYALNGSGRSAPVPSGSAFAMDGAGNVRQLVSELKYIFRGTGFGHGAGMSQWGARGLADMGYDYQKILQYYYEGVTIAKD